MFKIVDRHRHKIVVIQVVKELGNAFAVRQRRSFDRVFVSEGSMSYNASVRRWLLSPLVVVFVSGFNRPWRMLLLVSRNAQRASDWEEVVFGILALEHLPVDLGISEIIVLGAV